MRGANDRAEPPIQGHASFILGPESRWQIFQWIKQIKHNTKFILACTGFGVDSQRSCQLIMHGRARIVTLFFKFGWVQD